MLLLLLPVLTRAADVEPPPADVSSWGRIIFALVFLAMVVGFGLFIWIKERDRKQNETRG